MHSRAALFRFTTWLSLAGYVLVASGLPLPVDPVPMAAAAGAKRLAVKDRTQPFPCMDKPCGCATADQCFTRCCCNTPSQTLAWAKAHRVDSAVIAALQRRVAAEPADASADATCCSTSDHLGSDHLGSKQASCCSATAAVAVEPTGGSEEVVSTATPPVVGSSPGGASRGGAFQIGGAEVCSEYRSLATTQETGEPSSVGQPPADDAAPAAPPPGRTVVLRSMLACGGIVAEWFVAGVSLPPPLVEVVCRLDPIGRVAVVDESASRPRAAPAAPPPRAA